jgi:hypothetical protein
VAFIIDRSPCYTIWRYIKIDVAMGGNKVKVIDRRKYSMYSNSGAGAAVSARGANIRGVKRKAPWKLALSLLLIAALIIPQAVLAADAAEPQAAAGQSTLAIDGDVADNDGEITADSDNTDNDGEVTPDEVTADDNTDNNLGITIDSALTAGEDSLEDSGGGGRPLN